MRIKLGLLLIDVHSFPGFFIFNLLLSAHCWREVCGGKRFVTAKFVVRRSRRKKVQWTALTNHQGHSFILSTERNVSNQRHFDNISCQSFLMWKMDKHLVSTKYLRWIYAVHEYEHWAGSLSEELVCSKIWEAWWPKSWFLHKSTKPATRCGSFITNPAVELLATAAVNSVHWAYRIYYGNNANTL